MNTPETPTIADFMDATRNTNAFRDVREKSPNFNLANVDGATDVQIFIWEERVRLDAISVQDVSHKLSLDGYIAEKLDGQTAKTPSAARAWLLAPDAEGYGSTRSEEVARAFVKLATAPKFEVFTLADLARLPRPKWLVRGLIVENTISVLSADGGSFKSFFALDLALSIATGLPFHGREVKRGTVVYVAAEGFYTVYERALAWCQVRGVELPTNFHILRAPVNVSDAPQVEKFVAQFKLLSPDFVVLDTLSQNALGLNENANDEMARFMAGMAATGEAIGAHVMAVHHNAKATGAFRGAGAIKNNVDAHISLDRPEGDETNTVFVRCEKQRGRPFEPFALRGDVIELPITDEFGDPITSLVFELTGEEVAPKSAKHPNAKRADTTRARLMEIFDACAIEGAKFGGVKVGFWKEAVEETEPPICAERTFWKYREALEKDGSIEQCGSHNGSATYQRPEPTATTATTALCSCDSRPNMHCNNCNNPLGVAVSAVGVAVAVADEKKQPKKRAKGNADSEPYKATENDELLDQIGAQLRRQGETI